MNNNMSSHALVLSIWLAILNIVFYYNLPFVTYLLIGTMGIIASGVVFTSMIAYALDVLPSDVQKNITERKRQHSPSMMLKILLAISVYNIYLAGYVFLAGFMTATVITVTLSTVIIKLSPKKEGTFHD